MGTKQTEIGKIPEDWEVTNLAEVITINPKRNLKKGVKAKYVSMQDLKEYNKNIQKYLIREFKGGSKFINGDTIMARITPCLENGKTAFVDILGEGEIGFGSTEFIVLCGKNGKTTNDFVYYLSISPQLRAQAINSMTGTSGRQRVQVDLLGTIEISLPPLPEQKAIARILSSLDDKIELNHRMNKTLEAIAQAIFKHWFVDFEFPNEEGKPYKSSGGEMEYNEELGKEIPKGWEVGELGNFIEFIKGRKPKEVADKYINGYLPQILIDVLDGGKPSYANPKEMIVVKKNEPVMVMDGASSGRVEIGHEGILGSTLAKVVSIEDHLSNWYLYYFLKAREKDINQNTTGTSIPHTDKGRVKKYKLVIPSKNVLSRFDELSSQILKKIINNKLEIKSLSKIRDALLPKLMSGEIRVKVEVK